MVSIARSSPFHGDRRPVLLACSLPGPLGSPRGAAPVVAAPPLQLPLRGLGIHAFRRARRCDVCAARL
eukprot:7356332-Pyramimonas_sp.AAC.1